jgi:P2 family phage contractile tail tube protein
MLPFKLKNFNLHGNGESFLHQVAEIQLPKIAEKVEAWRGGGMGLEKMEMETTFGGLPRSVLRSFGIVGVASQQLRFTGAYQEEGDGNVMSAELTVRGKHVEIDPGGAKTGDDTGWKLKSTLAYLKWTVNGVVDVEIDMLACIFMVGGVDRYAALRSVLSGDAGISVSLGAGGLSGSISF